MNKHNVLHVFYFVLVIGMLFAYTGCAGGGIGGPSEPDFYRSGSQGIELRLYSQNTYRFYENDELNILLEMRNRGTHDVEGGRLFVSGYDPVYMGELRIEGDSLANSFHIDGKNEYDPNGEQVQLYTIESSRRISIPDGVDRFTQNLQITACYDYETYATAEICVDPDPNNRQVGNKVCNLQARNYGAQGHPVVVQSIEPVVSSSGTGGGSKEIRFNIRFGNSGGGTIIDTRLADTDKCLTGFDRRDIDIVDFQAFLGGTRLDCEPSSDIRLLNGAGLVSCKCDYGCVRDSAYWSLLEMRIDYGYMDSIQAPVTIIRD